MSLTSPDIRPSCGQASGTVRRYLGGCFQNKDRNIDGVTILRNVTMMKDYASGSEYNPAGIQPYAFANVDGPGGSPPCCAPYQEVCLPVYECGATGGSGNGNLPCGLPLAADIMTCGGSPTTSFTTGLGPYHNCYVATNETKSFSNCYNVGFKNAYAYKTHFGRLSYTSRMGSPNFPDLFDWAGCGCGYHDYDPTPDGTRYLAISANSEFSWCHQDYCINQSDGGVYTCDDVDYPNCCTSLGVEYVNNCDSGYANNSVHVDRYSGNFYVDSCGSGSGTYTTTGQGCTCDCDTGDCGCAYSTGEGASGCCSCTRQATGGSARDQADIDLSLANNAAYAWGLIGMANGTVMDVGNLWQQYSSCGYACDPDNPSCTCTVSGGGNAWEMTFSIPVNCVDMTDPCNPVYSQEFQITRRIVINYDAGTSDLYDYYDSTWQLGCATDGGCNDLTAYSHQHYSIGPTSYSYTLDSDAWNSASLHMINHEEVTGTLSSPYTTDEVYNECVALLANLPLDRDDLLPWRSDTAITTGPLVHYEEHGSGIPFVGTCQSETGSLASGTIMGIPGPRGIDHVFNPGHWNQCVCTDPLGSCGPNTCMYTQDFGAWNDGIGGGSATEWTNGYQSSCIPQYAFVSNYTFTTVPCTCNSAGPSDLIPSTTLWMGKWAEIIIPKQSMNYARPCGIKDRFAVTQSSGQCIKELTDGTITLDDYEYATTLVTDDLAWVCGTGNWDGCWKVTSDGYHSITLVEPRLISASWVQDELDWQDCGTGMIGKIYWQYQSKLIPNAICGHVAINNVISASGPCTVSLAENCGLVEDDWVTISGSKGGNINGSWQITVMSASMIGLKGSNFVSPYTSSGHIWSTFGIDWKWNDVSTKNDYTTIEWEYDLRKAGEYYRLVASAEWNAGLGGPVLTSGNCCQETCGDVGTCPGPTQIPLPHPNSCYGPYLNEVTCSTSCLPFNACAPVVAFWSPNNENFKTGSNVVSARNHGFGRPVMDEQYGCLWQGVIKQAMTDPLHHPAPCACGLNDNEPPYYETCPGCSWREDSGYTCPADQAGDPDLGIPCYKYYAGRDIFEARCEVPDGVPTLPIGPNIGCTKVDEACGAKPYCSPPSWDGYGFLDQGDGCVAHTIPYALPWIDFINRYNCVCGDGRFAEEYRANGVTCDDAIVAPP